MTKTLSQVVCTKSNSFSVYFIFKNAQITWTLSLRNEPTSFSRGELLYYSVSEIMIKQQVYLCHICGDISSSLHRVTESGRMRTRVEGGCGGGTLAAIIISYSALGVRAAQTIEDFVFFRLVTRGGNPDISLSTNTPPLFWPPWQFDAQRWQDARRFFPRLMYF